MAVAGLVLDGVVHQRILHDIALGLLAAGGLLIALSIDGFGQAAQKWIAERQRKNQTRL